MGLLIIKTPVKALKPDFENSVILESADGVRHYWDNNGEYAGNDREGEHRTLAEQTELKLWV